MATEFYNRNWRMPNSWNGSTDNNNKVSNYSMSFDSASSQKIDAIIPALNNATSLTFSYWTKKSAGSVVGVESFVNSTDRIILYWWSNDIVFWSVRNGSSSSAATSSLTLYDWNHILGTFDGATNTIKLYINGTLVDTQTGQPSSTSANLSHNFHIGLSNGSTYNTGQLDHVSIFDYALSASQVTSLYGNSTDGVGNPMAITGGRKPVAYYPIGDYAAFNGSEYLVNNGALQDYVFDFDIGTNDYIDLGSGISQSFSELSISTWINVPSSASGAYDTIIRRGTWSAGAFELRNNASYAGLKFAIYPGTANVTTTGVTLNDGNWHHILITYDGTNVKIYVDGS